MHIDPDTPVSDVGEDQYGFSETVVPRLVDLATKWPSHSGAVVALVGTWGSGKTSVLRMAEAGIKRAIGDDSVLPFSPWSYDDPTALTLAFFGVLKNRLSASDDVDLSKVGTILGRIGTGLGVAAGGIKLWGLSVDPQVLSEAARMLGGTSDLLDSFGKANASVLEAHAEARAALSELVKSGRRLVVLLDDIDRLSYTELTTLFRLIRTIADLPGITLVAAMDEQRVRRLLRRGLGDDFGAEYLDKIVQARLHVPAPTPLRLRKAITSRLGAVLAAAQLDCPDELTYSRLWVHRELRTIEGLLTTPRDAVRFTNAFAILIHGAGGEHVDVIDAAVLTALDIAAPEAYQAIYSHRDLFLGTDEIPTIREDSQEAIQQRAGALEAILDALPEGSPVSLVREAVDILFGDVRRRARERARLFRQGRVRTIADPAHFDTYFLAAAPRLLTVQRADELARWVLLQDEGVSESTVAAFAALQDEGVHQVLKDLDLHLASVGSLDMGRSCQRIVELGRKLAGAAQKEFTASLAWQAIVRRPQASESQWRAFLCELKAPLTELEWIDLVRGALNQYSPVPDAWRHAAQEWVDQQRRRLAAIDIPPWSDDDLTDWIVTLRLVGRQLDADGNTVADVNREIGAAVGQRPDLLPVLLRSVSVSSGDWVGLTGSVVAPSKAIANVMMHFGSLDALRDVIAAWRSLPNTRDQHGLTSELEALLRDQSAEVDV